MKVVAMEQAALIPAIKLPETFETPPTRQRWPTAISRAERSAAATRINISRFQPYVMSLMPRRSSTSRRIARNGERSLKRAP
jgi:hypothetical protein